MLYYNNMLHALDKRVNFMCTGRPYHSCTALHWIYIVFDAPYFYLSAFSSIQYFSKNCIIVLSMTLKMNFMHGPSLLGHTCRIITVKIRGLLKRLILRVDLFYVATLSRKL